MDAVIKAHGLQKYFGTFHVLKNIDFEIAKVKWSASSGHRVPGKAPSCDAAARLGMKQGRYDAVVQGIETIAYQMKIEPDTYKLVGDPLLSNDTFGIGFKKDNTALRDAVSVALDRLIKDGTYDQILIKWGLVHNGVSKAVVNGVK